MVVFPNAKINLGLNIIRKRADGYHELETCFCPVPWNDVLEIIEADKTTFSASGIPIPDDGQNIVLKAYQLIKAEFDLPPVAIHLHKVIPIGAGLGGGSSDAAYTISLLNELFSIGLNDHQMINYAAQLGADCAFFIKNEPCLASGVGEQLAPLNISFIGHQIFLVYPNLHISTKVAFEGIVPQVPSKKISDILSDKPMKEWRGELGNDFETPLFKKFPILNEIKKSFYENGALYASMSGSGSCIYGIFEEEINIEMPNEYTCFSAVL